MENQLTMHLNFEGCLRAYGAGAHAETMGNVCSFAHAKYGANPCQGPLFRDQITFFFFATILWELSALRASTVGPSDDINILRRDRIAPKRSNMSHIIYSLCGLFYFQLDRWLLICGLRTGVAVGSNDLNHLQGSLLCQP